MPTPRVSIELVNTINGAPPGSIIKQSTDIQIGDQQLATQMFNIFQMEKGKEVIEKKLKCYLRCIQRSGDLILQIEPYTQGDDNAFRTSHRFLLIWAKSCLWGKTLSLSEIVEAFGDAHKDFACVGTQPEGNAVVVVVNRAQLVSTGAGFGRLVAEYVYSSRLSTPISMSQEYWDTYFSGSCHFFDPVTLTPGSSRFSKDIPGRSFVEEMLACRFVLATFRRAQNQTYLLAMPSSAALDEQLVFKYMRRWDSPGTSQGSMYILGVPFPKF
jgi:hypothetical protein